MYYEKKIQPLDKNGNFLLAVHFPRHKIGGECTRESKHAYFAFGNIDTLNDLTDITSLCCLDRKPSQVEARQFQQISDIQKSMVGNEKTAWEYAYQAELASKEAQFVPRKVLTSTNGILVIGMECSSETGTPYAIQRVIDVFNNSILHEQKETQWPKGNAVAYPHALSSDGRSIIYLDVSNPNKPVFNEQGLSDQKTIVPYTQMAPITQFVSRNDGWIAVDEDIIYTFHSGDASPIHELKAPKQVFAWTAEAAFESDIVAFSGDKGLISIINTSTGKTKTYYPHRGCKRNDLAQVKLSPDGKWMASKLHNKSDLVVTQLNHGTSWKVGDIEEQVIIEREEGDYISKSSIPAAFAFIGSRLIVCENNGVREVSIKEPEATDQVFVSEQGMPGARVPLKITPKATIDKIIKEAKLERHEIQIKDLYYPSLKIKSKKPKKSGWNMPDKKGAPTLGESRLGGWPDLPTGMNWPMWDGRPMGFLAQINLEEASAVQPNIRLPKEGLLLFFIGCNEETYENDDLNRETYMLDIMVGSTQEQKGGWKVIYAKPGTNLNRAIFDGDIAPEIFQPSLLKMIKGGMPLPHEATAAYDCLDLNQNEQDNYNEVLDLLVEEYPENQLMGYPHLIQFTPPELYCTSASTGKSPFDYPPQDSDEFKWLEQQASEWGLLLQLTSDDNPNFLWGDAGHFYFYGNRKEMEAGNFNNTWVYYEN